jgi:hypothetical protein
MIRLSEIVEKGPGEIGPALYGIEVDVESFTPPAGLEEVSLIYKADGSDIDETLMDVIISYGLAGVEVILDVPAEQGDIDPKYLVSVAANAGFSIALLPPVQRDEAGDAAYFKRLREFARVYLTQANFGKFIAPVTNYLEYLFVELLKGEDSEFNTTDEYIKQRFIPLSDPEFVHAFKDSLRADFYELFGGRNEFERFARRMMSQIHSFAGECAVDIKKQFAGPSGGQPSEADAPAG